MLTTLVSYYLASCSRSFRTVSATPLLDARLILGYCLAITQAQLLALEPEHRLTSIQQHQLTALVQQRLEGYPVAYLIGYQEFYGYSFKVAPGVLIPRADSEIIIETLMALHQIHPIKTLRDVGTGPGTLAITLQLKLGCQVTASDISSEAAALFNINNEQLANGVVLFIKQSLLDDLQCYDAIVANLPYLTTAEVYEKIGHEQWKEPALALDGGYDGLQLIATLIRQSHGRCRILLLEADPRQMTSIRELMVNAALTDIQTFNDLRGDQRIIVGYNHLYRGYNDENN